MAEDGITCVTLWDNLQRIFDILLRLEKIILFLPQNFSVF